MAIKNKLKYTLVCDGYGTQEVTPLGESNLKMTFQLQNDATSPVYRYDVVFSGSLTFIGADFDFIYGAETSGYRCAEMFIEIETIDCETEELAQILNGTKIKLSEGEWDIDKCSVTMPVKSPQNYECVALNGDDELNMFDASPDAVSSRLYSYEPTFQYHTCDKVPTEYFLFTEQNFQNYPDRKSEYPGFGCDGEIALPYYYQSGPGSEKLFESQDMKRLSTNPTTFEDILSTGAVPYHNLYSDDPAGAFSAVAEGWRLCWFKYNIISFTDASGVDDPVMIFIGRWKWCREILDVPPGDPSPGDDWVFVEAAATYDRYARPPLMVPRSRRNIPSSTLEELGGAIGIYYISLYSSNYIVGETTSIVEPEFGSLDQGDDNKFGIKGLPNGRKLNDVILFAVENVCPDLEVKSDFFQINADTPTTTNYVTEEESTVDQIVLYQKSDVKRPWVSSPATRGIFTFNELTQWLWDMFQVKYTIQAGTIYFEHISHPIFRKPPVIDLTAPPYNKYTRGKRQYRYFTDELAAKETFAPMEARKQVTFGPTDDFAGVPILYDGQCVNRKEGESVLARSLNRVTNDIVFILLNSGGSETFVVDNETSNPYKVNTEVDKGVISNDGFCFVSTKLDGGAHYIRTKPTILGTVDYFNNVMGYAFLHDMFFRHERNAPTGTLNGASVTFASTKYAKKQTRLPFANCCIVGYDPHEMITGDFGNAVMDRGEWSPSNNIMEVDLAYQI